MCMYIHIHTSTYTQTHTHIERLLAPSTIEMEMQFSIIYYALYHSVIISAKIFNYSETVMT